MKRDEGRGRAIDEVSRRYCEEVWGAAMDDQVRLALSRAVEAFRANRDDALRLYPRVVEKARRLREVKDSSLGRVGELAKEARDRLEDLGGHCVVAEGPGDALKYVGEVVRSGDVVVKAKSLTCDEIQLNRHLEGLGCRVYETDLGEFIVQQLGDRPMHILAPAVHVPRERVAQLFSKLVGRPLPPDIPTLVGEARAYLRRAFFEAGVGVSGANAVAAETGTVFVVENEGNARLATGLPERHIVVAGLEKLVPTLEDGLLVAEVASRYANYRAPSYVSLITGPSKTGDIEKQTVLGAHGPRELHLILLDNHRTEMIRDPTYRQALRCLRCGACLYECPVYPITAGYFGHVYMGGIGAILTRFLAGGVENAAPIAYTCTLCGRCKEYCPMEIDVPEMILKLRRELAESGLVPSPIREVAEQIIEKGSLE